MIAATRYHDFSCGHRVVGHESKCAHLHGHNYRVHFDVVGDLDSVGRVLDFSVIKNLLCVWVEEHWDHKFLAWQQDAVMLAVDDILIKHAQNNIGDTDARAGSMSIIWVPFNPTAENMAYYLLHQVGPQQLRGTGIRLAQVTVEETRKCSATAALENLNASM